MAPPRRALLALALCLLASAAAARPLVTRSLAETATCPSGYEPGSGAEAGVNALCAEKKDGCYMYGHGCACPPTFWNATVVECPAGCSLTPGKQPFFNEGKCFCDAPPAYCVPADAPTDTCPSGYEPGSGAEAGVNALCAENKDGCSMYGNSCVCPPSVWTPKDVQCPVGCSLTPGKEPFFNEGKCFCDAPPANCVPSPPSAVTTAAATATCPSGYKHGSGAEAGVNALCAEKKDGCYIYGNGCVCPPTVWTPKEVECPTGCSLTPGKQPFFNEGKCFCDAPPSDCVAA